MPTEVSKVDASIDQDKDYRLLFRHWADNLDVFWVIFFDHTSELDTIYNVKELAWVFVGEGAFSPPHPPISPRLLITT